jgi:hypothetical protein
MLRTARGRTVLSALISAVACLPLAACGSSKSTSSSTTTTVVLTKTQFLARGNLICAQADNKQNADTLVYAKAHHYNLKTQPTPAELNALAMHVAIPDIQANVLELRGLGAPSGDQTKVKAILDNAQQALDKVKQNPSLLGSGRPFAAVAKQLHAYGLTECAKNA